VFQINKKDYVPSPNLTNIPCKYPMSSGKKSITGKKKCLEKQSLDKNEATILQHGALLSKLVTIIDNHFFYHRGSSEG